MKIFLHAGVIKVDTVLKVLLYIRTHEPVAPAVQVTVGPLVRGNQGRQPGVKLEGIVFKLGIGWSINTPAPGEDLQENHLFDSPV